MSDGINRFLGDTPVRIAIKLVVVSIVVGFIMKVFGWYPIDIFNSIRHILIDIWNSGFAALGQFGDYLFLGAAVVIPAFILIRILQYRR